MARPQRLNADYFPHDADSSANEKIVYLESLFGDSGYCWYFKMLEALTSSNHYEIEWSDMKASIYARRFNAPVEAFKSFIVAATTPEVAAFTIENGKLFSSGLKKRLSVVDDKRKRDAARLAERRTFGVVAATIPVVAATTAVVAPVNKQSKVKESKVKESKYYSKESSSKSAHSLSENENFSSEEKPNGLQTGPAALIFSASPWAGASVAEFGAGMLAFNPALPPDFSAGWYLERVKNWSAEKGTTSRDWAATAARFCAEDAAKGALVTNSNSNQNQRKNGNGYKNGDQQLAEGIARTIQLSQGIDFDTF